MDIEDLRREIESLYLEIKGHGYTLSSDALLQLAAQQGWKIGKGKGSHHCFRRPHYDTITLSHRSEYSQDVIKETLEKIFQPALDQVWQTHYDKILAGKIDDFIRDFQSLCISAKIEVYQDIETRKEILLNKLDEIDIQIKALENQKLDEAGYTVDELLDDLNQAQLSRDALLFEKQKLEKQLNTSPAIEHSYESRIQELMASLHVKEAKIMELNIQLTQAQTKQAELHQKFELLAQQIQSLTAHIQRREVEFSEELATENARNEDLHSNMKALKYQLTEASAEQKRLQNQNQTQAAQFRNREAALELDIRSLTAKASEKINEIARSDRGLEAKAKQLQSTNQDKDTIQRLEAELEAARSQLAHAVNRGSVQAWLREVRSRVRVQGTRRWLVQAAVAIAVFCVGWISRFL